MFQNMNQNFKLHFNKSNILIIILIFVIYYQIIFIKNLIKNYIELIYLKHITKINEFRKNNFYCLR